MSTEESFDTIIDPETNHPVPVESKVGQQVINNYLECLKNGPDSPNIVSTKVFYRKKTSSSKSGSASSRPSGGSSRPSGGSSRPSGGSSRPSGNSSRPSGGSSRPSGGGSRPSGGGSRASGGGSQLSANSGRTLRAKCSGPCGGTNIYSDDPRVKSSGKYYHQRCFDKINKN